MLQAVWSHCTIDDPQKAMAMVKLYKNTEHIAAAFDTETDGLHIIHNKPFLFQFGWVTPDKKGYTYLVDLERNPVLSRQVINAWHDLVHSAPKYLAHNVKYDLHMLHNIGCPYNGDNLSDTLFYIRYGHDALTVENGGPPLKLKDYAARYIDPSAKYHERQLDKEKSLIAKNYNNMLKAALVSCKPPADMHTKSYTLKVFDELFKDPVFTAEQLPDDAKLIYYDWLNNTVPSYIRNKVDSIVKPDYVPYNKLDRKTLYKYAHLDIVWVLESYMQLEPVVRARGNERGVEIEEQLIPALVEMERVGFKARVDYLYNCKELMAEYILDRRRTLYDLAGCKIKIGQHDKIKQIIASKYGIVLPSTGGEELKQTKSQKLREDSDRYKGFADFVDVIEELRTLEKWYSTYILRFLRDLKNDDRLYTTIHQVGTVSGRVTSDFQQFPKDAIKTKDGVELFSPRKLIERTGGDYDSIVYLDYSQIELRFQALYTILVGHPDVNLCRAYMPYECQDADGVAFDYNNQEHIKTAYSKPWYYKEEPTKQWVPTDVHGATTKAAFDIDETHPDFHKLRYVGKRVNFAKNYGAQYGKICQMFPERTPDECRKIDAAYYTAFPGVREYHNYCYMRADYAYTSNLFGIRYYGVSGHKLINILVQGSAAFYLKLKIIELYKYSKANNLKTRWQMQIHDELSWEHHKDEDPAVFFAFKQIMEHWPDGVVPIVADMELTTSTWAAKEEVSTLEEVQNCLGA